MSTTEVYVEQLIIGGIVLLIAVVLWTGSVPPLSVFGWETGPSAVVVLGLAYLTGLLFDRIGDTLLERIEKRQRLELARKSSRVRPWLDDPFPEDLYRAAVYRNEHLVRRHDYLRIRMRLSRAVAVLAPAGVIALIVHLAMLTERRRLRVAIAVVAVYALVGALNVIVARANDLPRTNAPGFATYVKLDSVTRWASAYAPALTGLSCFTQIMSRFDRPGRLLTLAGVLLTILATWVWIRITGTYLAFLADVKKT